MVVDKPQQVTEIPPAEQELVARLKQGDDDAYRQIIREYAPRMLAVARRFVQQEDDAQEVLQEALYSACRAIAKFEGQSRLATWMHRITVNAALMRLRKKRSRAEQPIDELLPRYLDDGHRADVEDAWTMTSEQAAESRELAELVRGCIDRLPESFRTVLLLRDIEERSTEETAELLDIEPGAVKTRLHRARQALRTLLDPYMRA